LPPPLTPFPPLLDPAPELLLPLLPLFDPAPLLDPALLLDPELLPAPEIAPELAPLLDPALLPGPELAFEPEPLDPAPLPIGADDVVGIAVTGQTVVYRSISSVVTWPRRAGQLVMVGAQEVMVYVIVVRTVLVVSSGLLEDVVMGDDAVVELGLPPLDDAAPDVVRMEVGVVVAGTDEVDEFEYRTPE